MRKIALALVCFLAACQTTQAPLTAFEFPGRITPITYPIKVPFKAYHVTQTMSSVVRTPTGEVSSALEGEVTVDATLTGSNLSISYNAGKARSTEFIVSPDLRIVKSNVVYTEPYAGMSEQEAYEFTITGNAFVLPPYGVKTGDNILCAMDSRFNIPPDKVPYIKVKGSAFSKGRQIIVSDLVLYRRLDKADWVELKGFAVHDSNTGALMAMAANGKHASGYTVESGFYIK